MAFLSGKRFLRRRGSKLPARTDCGACAGQLFDQGQNCAQAVLQATTGREDPELLEMLDGFRGGIADTGCLCGAITGGVMALGLAGRPKQAKELMEEFKHRFGTTCCRGLSAGYTWLSREHLANCRAITVETAEIIDALLKK